ncbi:MAG: peptidylprolyl isomerase [Candidatus Neomarinimicrobiota bacterium]
MTVAKTGDKVQVHYKGSVEAGVVFDATPDDKPLEFTIGESKILPAFSEAIVGMEAGDRKTVQLQAEEAFGQAHEEMIITMDRTELPPGREPAVGQSMQARDPDGHQHDFIIVNIEGGKIVLDGNHPLAGKTLTFEIELLAIL